MSNKKTPSGALDRKRKLQHRKEDENQARALQRFLTTSPSCATRNIEATELTESDPDDDKKAISELLPGPSSSQDHLTVTTATPLAPSIIGCDITWTDTEDEDDDLIRDPVLPSRFLQALETKHWEEVLKRVLCVVRFLVTQGLALRGETDVLFERNNGNFLKLVEHIAKFDGVMAIHLKSITSKDILVNFLSKDVLNKFVSFLSAKIQDNISQQLCQTRYYSIIVDCTPDLGHTEQMSLVVRFLKCEENKDASIKEHFLGFFPVTHSSGEGLAEIILRELEARGIPLKSMRGQAYYNGSAMMGKYAGVQRKILELNPRAFYVPCGSHSLNLVLSDAALSCSTAVDCFSTIRDIFNFFSSSTQRWRILLKHVPTFTVKPLCNTRWESRVEALVPLRFHIEDVHDALYEASQEQKLDAFGRNTAIALLEKLQSFQFLCCLVTWYEILNKVNMVSKLSQKVTNDLQSLMDLMESVKSFLERMRSDQGLDSVILDAKGLAEKTDVAADFEEETLVRPRKVSRHFSSESEDEAVHSGKDSFRVNFFFVVLDTAISALKERFELMEDHSESFKFLYDISSLGKSMTETELKNACEHLQTVLTDGEECDVEADALCNELQVFATVLPPGSHPAEALSFITRRGYVGIFPYVYIVLRILLTLPISVASGERGFSKLKRIKAYLSSTLSQERLGGLPTLAIENDLLDEMNTDSLVHEFSELEARNISF